ncbi:MAG: hypothetical protein HQL58_02065 [Magnetococcales bacterium]|nr:hypothetical protein [Magnetococcales bacterium]
MRMFAIALFGLVALSQGTAASAAGDYTIPAGEAQYINCKNYSMNKWDGGGDPSPITGQTKAEAFCICLWNETPDNFRGGLAKFSETEAGAGLSARCSKYANWE